MWRHIAGYNNVELMCIAQFGNVILLKLSQSLEWIEIRHRTFNLESNLIILLRYLQRSQTKQTLGMSKIFHVFKWHIFLWTHGLILFFISCFIDSFKLEACKGIVGWFNELTMSNHFVNTILWLWWNCAYNIGLGYYSFCYNW